MINEVKEQPAPDIARPKGNCRCGARSVYFRSYNGESLCAICFTASIFEKAKKVISKYGMLHYRDSVAVALSGGKDSSSLLYVLSEVMKGHGSKLQALTIDEGIAGYRDESIRNAERLAEKLSIPLLVCSYKDFFGFTLDEALQNRNKELAKSTSCAVCGPLRRRSIDRAAYKLGVNVVATAHNLDDMLQTFFINLYSGDVERIKWLDPGFKLKSTDFKLRRIKPFMEIYEQELAFFAYINDLPFQSESCPYKRARAQTSRNKVLDSEDCAPNGLEHADRTHTVEKSDEVRKMRRCLDREYLLGLPDDTAGITKFGSLEWGRRRTALGAGFTLLPELR